MLKKAVVLAFSSMLSLVCLAQSGGNTEDKAAQANAPKKFYKLDFVVREVENGHVVNSRSYSIITREGDRDASFVRADSRVPVTEGKPSNQQFTQVNLGVDIDCSVGEEVGQQVPVRVNAEVKTYMPDSLGADVGAPITRNNQWRSWSLVPLRQPSILFSADDLASKRTTQLQLTVTPVK